MNELVWGLVEGHRWSGVQDESHVASCLAAEVAKIISGLSVNGVALTERLDEVLWLAETGTDMSDDPDSQEACGALRELIDNGGSEEDTDSYST